MPTTPLFVADLDTLKGKLRLSGIEAGTDAENMLDEAVLTVRAGFFREIGQERVGIIQAITFVADPTTNEQALRATANVCEVKWVRAEVLRTMPTVFQDSSAEAANIFQTEALFRDTSDQQIETQRRHLMSEIEDHLDLLRGDELIGDSADSGLKYFSSESQTRRLPGGDIRPPALGGRGST